MNNIISHNVGICSRDDNCGSRGLHWQDNGEVRVTQTANKTSFIRIIFCRILFQVVYMVME